MTVDQVSSLLGNPRNNEMVPVKGKTYEVIRYQTKFSGDAVFVAPDEEDMTPFVFVDGKLLGWGRAYYQSLLSNLKLTLRSEISVIADNSVQPARFHILFGSGGLIYLARRSGCPHFRH